MPMADAVFEKHVYGRERKRTLKPLEEFDPRPVQYRGTAKDHLPALLDKLHGKGLCISLTLDPKMQSRKDMASDANDAMIQQIPPQLPSKTELEERVAEFTKV